MSSVNFEKAEKNARLRDIQNDKVLTEEELEIANKLQAKANAKGMKLVPDKKVKSRVRFAQIIQENWLYLNSINYLTVAEKAFLLDIAPYVGFLSNCIVEDIKAKSQVPCTQESLGKKIGKNKSQMSKILKPLIEKGIMARSITGGEDYNAKSYALFLNPNIIYCGDRDSVNDTLKAIFYRSPKELKKLPVKLF